MPLFPGTEANTFDGPIRVVYAPTTVAVPTREADVIDVIGPNYNPKVGWVDAGFLTEDETEYERDMSSDELRVDQRDASILDRITEIGRTFTVPFAEITPEIMKIAEEGAAIATLAAVPGVAAAAKGASKALDFGTFDTLTRYRFALIARTDAALAPVTEGANGNAVRGAFRTLLFYRAAIAAEGSSMAVQKGSLTNREITFKVFNETTISDPKKQHGRYVAEDAPQTIAAA